MAGGTVEFFNGVEGYGLVAPDEGGDTCVQWTISVAPRARTLSMHRGA